MTDAAFLAHQCKAWVQSLELTPVGEVFYSFKPTAPHPGGQSGVTGVVLLAESHVAIHTWPELNAVTLDVYVCNFDQDNSKKAQQLMQLMILAFQPGEIHQQQIVRGQRPRSVQKEAS